MTGVTVSGLTMASAGRQSRQKWDSQIHNRRSLEVNIRPFSCGPLKHTDSVPQSQVPELKGSTRTEDRG